MSSPVLQEVDIPKAVTQPDSASAEETVDSVQQQAIKRAKVSFKKLPDENPVFQQYAGSKDGVKELVDTLAANYSAHDKRRSRIIDKFQRYSAFLQNFGDVIDIAVQTQAGIACPVWAPVKFVLNVCSLHFNQDMNPGNYANFDSINRSQIITMKLQSRYC